MPGNIAGPCAPDRLLACATRLTGPRDASLLCRTPADVDRLRLDHLIIDTHPGLNDETLLSIAVSDVLLLVLRPDQQDFQGTAVTADIARRLGVPELLLVVNKHAPWLDREALRGQVETAYGARVAGLFAHASEMLELQSGGIFSMRYPDHPFSREVAAMARELVAAPLRA